MQVLGQPHLVVRLQRVLDRPHLGLKHLVPLQLSGQPHLLIIPSGLLLQVLVPLMVLAVHPTLELSLPLVDLVRLDQQLRLLQ